MDEGVESLKPFEVFLAKTVLNSPLDLVRFLRLAAACEEHLVALLRKRPLQRLSDQPARTCDKDSHIESDKLQFVVRRRQTEVCRTCSTIFATCPARTEPSDLSLARSVVL